MRNYHPSEAGLTLFPVPDGELTLYFVECCTDTEIIQPEGDLEYQQFGTSQEEDPSWFASLFSLISSITLAEQPRLVVAEMRSSCGTIRRPCFSRTVLRIHHFSAEGHFLVPAIGFAKDWMPEDFPFVEFLLLHQRDTPTPISFSRCS